jgi:hypothetical protein
MDKAKWHERKEKKSIGKANQGFAEYNGIKIGFLNVRGPDKGCKNKPKCK